MYVCKHKSNVLYQHQQRPHTTRTKNLAARNVSAAPAHSLYTFIHGRMQARRICVSVHVRFTRRARHRYYNILQAHAHANGAVWRVRRMCVWNETFVRSSSSFVRYNMYQTTTTTTLTHTQMYTSIHSTRCANHADARVRCARYAPRETQHAQLSRTHESTNYTTSHYTGTGTSVAGSMRSCGVRLCFMYTSESMGRVEIHRCTDTHTHLDARRDSGWTGGWARTRGTRCFVWDAGGEGGWHTAQTVVATSARAAACAVECSCV